MTLTERDLRKLALPIVITLGLLGAAGALAWWTQDDARQAGLERNRAAEAKSRIEQRLLAGFPDEVARVWSRIGTAEVANDPMGTELTDIFIMLKPREQWKSAGT